MVRQSPVAPMTRTRRIAPSPAGDERGATGDHTAETATPPAAPTHAELGPIIRSKIQAPALRESTLSRKRLLDRLADSTRLRLTLLTAEAGYGKTTLLADFATHSSVRTIWYRLDPTDADIVTWTNHIVAAMREVDPAFGQATLDLMSHLPAGGPPRSAFVSSVIGELGRLEPVQTVLVLDDFHAVDTSDEASEFVVRLTRDAPPWLHLVVSARRRPKFEMGKLSAAGEVAELTTDDLRFSPEETVRLFAEAYATPLDEDVLRDLDGKLHGWAASLQLFHGSIRGRPSTEVRALAQAVSGATRPIYEFLAEEVLANLSPEIEHLLVRCSLLHRIRAGHVVALFGDAEPPPSLEAARTWLEEADRLMLLSRSSETSDARQLHPLLRDFLANLLEQRESRDAIGKMHLRVARAVEDADPLMAAHHYVEGGDDNAAMRCLGASVVLTMGSGQWGVASDLIERIKGVPADPAVAAIRARRLIEDGDLDGAAALLEGVDVSGSPADVRAVFRHARLSLGWRTGDRERMFATLAEIQDDADTPPILRDIFQIFVDASPLAATPVPFASLASRMERMAKAQRSAGHTYFAAISLHNAAIAALVAGRVSEGVRLAEEALTAFDALTFAASERYSTYAVLANCSFELGDVGGAERYLALGLGSGHEHADVHAEAAFLLAAVGDRERANTLLFTADALERNGLSDLQATTTATLARAMLALPASPERSLELLDGIPRERPLDVGGSLAREAIEAMAYLLWGQDRQAHALARASLDKVAAWAALGARARVAIVDAAAANDGDRLAAAITDGASVGELALLEMAHVVGHGLALLKAIPPALTSSITKWPARWLPVLRYQLERGPTASARAAAELLDVHGTLEDVIRLRAYAKTYATRGRVRPNLGRELARRVAPPLQVRDLGRGAIQVGPRETAISSVRRKPASLLMYLITRPNLTATREQVLEQLWPDSDPVSGNNSLNQSLYFIRREVDPWYEDDVSVDYIRLQGDLVWLERDLTRIDSVTFLESVRSIDWRVPDVDEVVRVVRSYRGQFAPEFEYEEWAIAWRSRVHATFLSFATNAIDSFSALNRPTDARDVAVHVLDADPSATEIEAKLIRLYWQLGARSAAAAQYAHFEADSKADGIEPPSLDELVLP